MGLCRWPLGTGKKGCDALAVLVKQEATCSDLKNNCPGEAVIGRGEGDMIEVGAALSTSGG